MRKNIFSIIILFTLIAMFFTGCTFVTVEEEEFIVMVTDCIQGEFHPDANYQVLATAALKKGSMTLYNYYNKLAQENGTYDYVISFNIDNVTHTVTRSTASQPGSSILVTKVITKDGNEILSTEYR